MSNLALNPEHIHIVASDLDGTLLLPNHLIGDFSKETLKKLHQQGMIFAFATGRHWVDVSSMRQAIDIPAYMITSNGARVHTPDNQVLYSKDIPAHVVQPIIDQLKDDPNLRLHIYRSDDWLTNKEDLMLSKHHQQTGFAYSIFDVNNAPSQDVAKIFFTNPDHDYLVEYETKLNQMFADDVVVAFSTPTCLEVMAKGVSKGDALLAVAQTLGKDLSHCLAFGDGMNDVEMLSMAGKGVLMNTAHYKVKQALPNTEQIGSCADESVAHYLENQLLKNNI